MTTEANIPSPQILEGLRQGLESDDKMMSLLWSLLGNGQLTSEEQMILELLMSLQDNEEDAGPQVINGNYEIVEDDLESPFDGRNAHNRSKIERLQTELADLREVNDTVAAALGACKYCWGGDELCTACEGRGRAGWLMPHPRLFEDLVVPAIRRVRVPRRKSKRSGDTWIRR